MAKILNPKDVTGTTRFNLDFELSSAVIVQLLKEFRKDYPHIKHNPGSVKLIDSKCKKGVEISSKFISFFPELTKEEAERVRKRIYKHIAKRSEVYYSTSRESLELSISSLLADDIRSCASLLYYALHKFINGSMYSYLNNQLKIEDYKIKLAEVDHFTSANFYAFSRLNNSSKEEIDSGNYREKLCVKNNSADPFLLIRYVIKGDLEELEGDLLPYTQYISNYLFGVNYDEPQFEQFLNELITQFFQKKKEKKPVSQEDEVKASIAFAIEKSLKEEKNKVIWMLYIIALRLYWLRQTADYEFDFEVKTSVREMSILLSSVKSFLDKQSEIEVQKKLGESKAKFTEPINNKGKTVEQEFEEKDDEIIFENLEKNFRKYSVDIKFPTEIHTNHEVAIFLTALHLDPFFLKEEIILVLNLTERITNDMKYFIFQSTNVLIPHLFVHINEDGRWTAWFEANDLKKFISFADLIDVFNEFLEVLKEGYKNVFDIDFTPVLIYSTPMHVKQPELLDLNSIVDVNKSVNWHKRRILSLLTSRLDRILDTPQKNSFSIQINKFVIEFNLIFNATRFLDAVPFDTLFFNKVVDNPDSNIVINLIVGHYETEQIEAIVGTAKRAYIDLINKFNMDNSIEGFMLVHVTPDEIEDFLEPINISENSLLDKILSCLNDVAYDRIMQGKLEGTEAIVEKYIKFPTLLPFGLANKGLLNLRDDSLPVDESEEKGKEYYEKAIDIESDTRGEYIIGLKQKYNYEMARFYLKRKIDLKKGYEYLQKAISFGEEEYFYKDAIKLNDEYMSRVSLEETALTTSSDEEIKEEDLDTENIDIKEEK